MKFIGNLLEAEEILDLFFDTDAFQMTEDGYTLSLIANRLRGETAQFDITNKKGEVLVTEGRPDGRRLSPAIWRQQRRFVMRGRGWLRRDAFTRTRILTGHPAPKDDSLWRCLYTQRWTEGEGFG